MKDTWAGIVEAWSFNKKASSTINQYFSQIFEYLILENISIKSHYWTSTLLNFGTAYSNVSSSILNRSSLIVRFSFHLMRVLWGLFCFRQNSSSSWPLFSLEFLTLSMFFHQFFKLIWSFFTNSNTNFVFHLNSKNFPTYRIFNHANLSSKNVL